jgi:hypothetical protein
LQFSTQQYLVPSPAFLVFATHISNISGNCFGKASMS